MRSPNAARPPADAATAAAARVSASSAASAQRTTEREGSISHRAYSLRSAASSDMALTCDHADKKAARSKR